MEKRKYKKGLTLIEILISIFMLGIITTFSYYVICRISEINYNNEKILVEVETIKKSYELFSVDPNNFKENIKIACLGYWEEDHYCFYDINEYNLKYKEDEKAIYI